MENDGISGYGESGMFEDAYRCWQRAGVYGNLAGNAANIVRQHVSAPERRAPLYRAEEIPVTFPPFASLIADMHRAGTASKSLAEVHRAWDLQPDSLLSKSAEWTVSEINSKVPARGLSVWSCEHETVTVADTHGAYITCKDYVL